jgi:5'-3' exonuclease
MGIKDLSKVIEETSGVVPLSLFSGHRVAIDGHAFLYIHMAVANKRALDFATESDLLDEDIYHERVFPYLQKQLRTAMDKFFRHRIIPIFVFDGKVPEEKAKLREKRKEKRATVESKISASRKKYLDTFPLERTPEMMVELKKLMAQDLRPGKLEFTFIKEILSHMKVPVFEAEGEGEKLASWMCKEGLVSAVYSTDTDCLTYGAPRVIVKSMGTSFDTEKMIHEETVKIYELDKILTHLELSFPSFVDLCIMTGCDYNTNIAGIGIVKSLKFIKQYECIENFLQGTNRTGEELNFIKCRELFDNSRNPFEIPMLALESQLELGEIDGETSHFLERYNMDGWVASLLDYYRDIDSQRTYQFVIF